MKKRVLSMLLALILCFSTLPMTAFAQEAVQEADVVTEQADPAAEQEEAEAAAGNRLCGRAGETAGSRLCGRAEGSRSSCGTGGRDSVR